MAQRVLPNQEDAEDARHRRHHARRVAVDQPQLLEQQEQRQHRHLRRDHERGGQHRAKTRSRPGNAAWRTRSRPVTLTATRERGDADGRRWQLLTKLRSQVQAARTARGSWQASDAAAAGAAAAISARLAGGHEGLANIQSSGNSVASGDAEQRSVHHNRARRPSSAASPRFALRGGWRSGRLGAVERAPAHPQGRDAAAARALMWRLRGRVGASGPFMSPPSTKRLALRRQYWRFGRITPTPATSSYAQRHWRFRRRAPLILPAACGSPRPRPPTRGRRRRAAGPRVRPQQDHQRAAYLHHAPRPHSSTVRGARTGAAPP